MQSDMQETAPPIPESAWVEGELIRSLMSTARNAQYLALLVLPVLFGVLYGNVPTAGLLLWTAAFLAVAAYRLWFMSLYDRRFAQAGTDEQLRFMARHGFSWPLIACIWGSSALLYFDKMPVDDQFICWLVLTGLGTFSISSFSAHLPTMRHYVNGMAWTLAAVLLWRMGVELRFAGPVHHYWLLFLLLMYWQLLLLAGRHMHETHRRSFELQYRNAQLIDSLTRQTQAALDAVEVKNRFLASAAHDIRQPVHALALYADWLGSEPELVRELAPKIVKSTKAVNNLFDSLFDLARLDSGQIRIRVEAIDLARLLRELELQYRPLAEAKGLQLRLRITPGEIMSDPIFLQRILGNLIANAVKYTVSGGILLASRATATGMRIEIWDTGIGIAQQHQREVFREFYKVAAHAGTDDGFGLGLAIVSRLTHILGHGLQLMSRPGRGTVFKLELKEIDAAQAQARAAAIRAQLVSRP
ncbi:MAG: sensor histidine kinase [Burkholderiaceae bacterium]